MALLRRLKVPFLIALVLTLAVILIDPALMKHGGPIILLVYTILMMFIIYREKRNGKRHTDRPD